MTCNDDILYPPKSRIVSHFTFHAQVLIDLKNMLNRTDSEILPLVNESSNSIIRLTLWKTQEAVRIKAMELEKLFKFMTNDIEEIQTKNRRKRDDKEYLGMYSMPGRHIGIFGRPGRGIKQIAKDMAIMAEDLQSEITENNNNVHLIFRLLANYGDMIKLIEHDILLLNAIRFNDSMFLHKNMPEMLISACKAKMAENNQYHETIRHKMVLELIRNTRIDIAMAKFKNQSGVIVPAITIMYEVTIPDLQVSYSVNNSVFNGLIINGNNKVKKKPSNLYWDSREVGSILNGVNRIRFMANSIIHVGINSTAPMFFQNEIIWMSHAHLHFHYVCSGRQAYKKVHNLTAIIPRNCEVYNKFPLFFIRPIDIEIISNLFEDTKYLKLWHNIADKAHFPITKSKFNIEMVKAEHDMMKEAIKEDRVITALTQKSWWDKLWDGIKDSIILVVTAGCAILIAVLAVLSLCLCKDQICSCLCSLCVCNIKKWRRKSNTESLNESKIYYIAKEKSKKIKDSNEILELGSNSETDNVTDNVTNEGGEPVIKVVKEVSTRFSHGTRSILPIERALLSCRWGGISAACSLQ